MNYSHLLGGGGFRYALGPFAATVAEIGDDFAAAAQDRQFAVVGAVMAPLAGGGDLLFAEAPADEVGRAPELTNFSRTRRAAPKAPITS